MKIRKIRLSNAKMKKVLKDKYWEEISNEEEALTFVKDVLEAHGYEVEIQEIDWFRKLLIDITEKRMKDLEKRLIELQKEEEAIKGEIERLEQKIKILKGESK